MRKPTALRRTPAVVPAAALALALALAGCGGSGPGSPGRPKQAAVRQPLVRTALGTVEHHRFRVEGVPYDTRVDFPHGPAAFFNVYAESFPLLVVRGPGGELGALWQEQTGLDVRMTWFGRGLDAPRTRTVLKGGGQVLAAAAQDGRGAIYFLTVQRGDGAPDDSRKAALHKAAPDGRLLRSVKLDGSRDGLNMVKFAREGRDIGYSANLAVADGTVGLMLGREMHRTPDGLNHQGGIAVVYAADTLKLIGNWGQTSGHSFGSRLAVNGQGRFVGIDLGDNYPRGVNLHVFDRSGMRSAVVYTYKTRHGITARSPAGRTYPRYDRISHGEDTFYQWSNDNNTYSELGGVVPGKAGYTVLFAGESHEGRALLNNRAGNYVNDSRNIGLVQVRPDFPDEGGHSNAVSEAIILSKGATEQGGFYTFGGTWSPQRNVGVVWLTDYSDGRNENVSRLHAVPLPGGAVLLLWEVWGLQRYRNTYALKIDETGKHLSKVVELGPAVRLPRSTSLTSDGRRVYVINGDHGEGTLDLSVLTVKP